METPYITQFASCTLYMCQYFVPSYQSSGDEMPHKAETTVFISFLGTHTLHPHLYLRVFSEEGRADGRGAGGLSPHSHSFSLIISARQISQ
jgi:hypothetical protein